MFVIIGKLSQTLHVLTSNIVSNIKSFDTEETDFHYTFVHISVVQLHSVYLGKLNSTLKLVKHLICITGFWSWFTIIFCCMLIVCDLCEMECQCVSIHLFLSSL